MHVFSAHSIVPSDFSNKRKFKDTIIKNFEMVLGALNHVGPGTGEVCYRSCCVMGHTGEAVQGPRDPLTVGPIPAGAVPTVGSQQARRGPCLGLFSVPPACADGGSEAARVSGKGSGLEGGAP